MSRLWQAASSAVLGRPDAVTVKHQAVDLGVPVHYSRALLPSDGPTRVRRARILADRILAASDDILIRARLIRGALYPKILYGIVRRVAQFKGRHAQRPASSLALYLHSVGLTMLPRVLLPSTPFHVPPLRQGSCWILSGA